MRIAPYLLLLAACTTADDDIDPDPPATGTTGTMRIRTHSGLVQSVTYRVQDGRAVWQGDIDLGPAPPPGLFADAIKDLSHRWPDGEIHFEIVQATFQNGQIVTMTQDTRDAIAAAIDDYVLRTPLKFVEHGTGSHPFIQFVPSAFSDHHSESDSIGPASTDPGARSTIFLDAEQAGETAAQHEIGHVVGFAHEQSRADRDAFLDYHDSCVIDADKSQFDKTGSDFEVFGQFDFSSIMLYASSDFCLTDPFGLPPDLDNNCLCFPLVKKGTPNNLHSCDATHTTNCTNGFFGRGTTLSPHDVRAVTRMYEPVLGAVEAGDSFGRAIARGDFDGDGIADLAIAAPEETPGGTDATGAVMIYRGTGDGLTAWRLIRESALSSLTANGDEFGQSLAAGDLDGDGRDDLAIGAPSAKASGSGVRGGAVYVLMGTPGGPGASVDADHALRFDSPKTTIRLDQNNATDATAEAGDQFGVSLSIGKIGASKGLAVGVPMDNVNGARTGRVNTLTYTGSPSAGPQFTNRGGVWQSTSAPTDQFGAAVELADFDDDGLGDVAVGVPQRGSGRVVIYRATATGYTSAQVLSASSGDLPGDRFGAALAVGDFDGATYGTSGRNKRELAIGAPGRDSGSGRVFVLRPQISAGLSFTEVTIIGQGTGNNIAGDALGSSLAAGTLGTDAFDDLAAGAPGKDVLGTNTGAVIRYDGSSTGIGSPTQVSWAVAEGGTEFPSVNDHAGTAVAIGRFDADGSGHGDIVTGAPGRKASSGALLEFDGNSLFKYIDEGNAHPE